MGLYIRAVGTPKEKIELLEAICHPRRFQLTKSLKAFNRLNYSDFIKDDQ